MFRNGVTTKTIGDLMTPPRVDKAVLCIQESPAYSESWILGSGIGELNEQDFDAINKKCLAPNGIVLSEHDQAKKHTDIFEYENHISGLLPEEYYQVIITRKPASNGELVTDIRVRDDLVSAPMSAAIGISAMGTGAVGISTIGTIMSGISSQPEALPLVCAALGGVVIGFGLEYYSSAITGKPLSTLLAETWNGTANLSGEGARWVATEVLGNKESLYNPNFHLGYAATTAWSKAVQLWRKF